MGKILDPNIGTQSTVSVQLDSNGAPIDSTLPEEKKEINPLLQMGGRPCGYCGNQEKIDKVIDDYIKSCQNPAKPKVPFSEELAMILDVDDETLQLWAEKKKKGSKELEHPALSATIKKMKNIQKFRLLQRTLGRYNPTGAIFQLKVNHGAIETEKQILAGDSKEPLEIIITEEQQRE